MDHMGSPPLRPADYSSNSTKRKRSPSAEPPKQPTPPAKQHKTHSNHHLQINYLVRQFQEILPLVSPEHDSLPSLLSLITDYEGVLHRHESMAGNLGARPLGPILIQRFERLFDGPPRVLKINGKSESTSVGWLDVVEFARNKPEQFKLEHFKDGVKVCQFYTKQCRVEISEEDFVLVKSGMPQKLIPPQPIGEDEEKELGTLEILEKALGGCVHLADQVAGRARQLNHKIRSRKNAIVSRREAEATADDTTPSRVPNHEGHGGHSRQPSNGERASNSPTGGGFVAVNSRYSIPAADRPSYNGSTHDQPRSSAPLTNGTAPLHVSAATRAELLSKFHTKSERSNSMGEGDQHHRPTSISRPTPLPTKPNSRPYADSMEYAGVLLNTASPVPIPHTPTSLLPYVKPSPADRFDDSGPFKSDMMARMEQLNRGDRVQPPCDRCRRLHMDCLKNLTACMGCTKKHAKCSWKDVEEQELKDHPFVLRVKTAEEIAAAERGSEGEGSPSGGDSVRKGSRREMMEVRDEELLGEESDDDAEMRDKPNETSPMIPNAIGPAPGRPSPSVNGVPSEAIHASDVATRAPDVLSLSRNASPTKSNYIQEITPKPALADSPKAQYQAPQAQMQSFRAHYETNGHVQTEYERDLYSQLSQATRESDEHEKATAHANEVTREPTEHEAAKGEKVPHQEPVRVYTAGTDPIQPELSPVQPMQLDPIQTLPSEPQPAAQEMPPERVPSTPVHSEHHTPKPQMPSPPLSGVPSHATPTPSTPVTEFPVAPQPMQMQI